MILPILMEVWSGHAAANNAAEGRRFDETKTKMDIGDAHRQSGRAVRPAGAGAAGPAAHGMAGAAGTGGAVGHCGGQNNIEYKQVINIII